MSVWIKPEFPAGTSQIYFISCDITALTLFPSANQAFGRIISKKLSWDGTTGFELEYNPVNSFVGVVGSGNAVAGFTATLANGKWYHLVAVISGGTATLYINNAAVGTPQPISPVAGMSTRETYSLILVISNRTNMTANTQALAIGRISGEAFVQNNYFYGSIDDVRIYNRALTAAEIKILYTTPYGGSLTSVSFLPSISRGPFTVPTFDPNFVDKTQLTGFTTPLGLAGSPDGRMFIWQKSGKVYVIDANGNQLLFADITPLVSHS